MRTDIDIDIDEVRVFGQRLARPASVSRSQWLKFWEAAPTEELDAWQKTQQHRLWP